MLKRLADERGMALPLALGIVLVLTISVVSVVAFAGASSRDASLNSARQKSKALAESGLNRAVSVLWANYQTNPTSPALPVCTGSPTACISGLPSGHRMTWSTTVSGTTTARVWTIVATGTVPNPTGPTATAITKTVRAKFRLGLTPDLEAWKGVYASNQGADCFMQNQIVVKTPVYIKQSDSSIPVCVKNNMTRYLGSFFAVKNARFVSLDLPTGSSAGATVGQRASTSQVGDPNYPAEYRVPDVHIERGCGGSAPSYTACTEAHGMWRCTNPPAPAAPCYSHTVPDIPKPPVDFTYWRSNAKPGPSHGCTAPYSSGTAPSFTSTSAVNLFPTSGYNCEVWEGGVRVGKLQWQPGTFSSSDVSGPKGTLTVEGVIYFSGKLEIFSVYAEVKGKGTIYVQDYVKMDATPGAICGKRDTAAGRPLCNWTEGSGGWDPGVTDDLLLFVTGQTAGTGGVSMDMLNQFEFQGAVYTVGKFILQGSAQFKGPLVTEKMELKNTAVIQGWTPLDIAFPGQPSSSEQRLTLVPGSWSG